MLLGCRLVLIAWNKPASARLVLAPTDQFGNKPSSDFVLITVGCIILLMKCGHQSTSGPSFLDQ